MFITGNNFNDRFDMILFVFELNIMECSVGKF